MRAVACILLVAAAVSCATAKNKKVDDKVKVAVYYEALCPDSKGFIVSQLAPVWQDLRGAVKVKLVPYGKATRDKVNGTYHFTCHHGPDECTGNKIQGCILKDKHLVDTDKVTLIVCLMREERPDKAFEACAKQLHLDAEIPKINGCVASDQGSVILAANGEKTDLVQKPLSFVPTVVINEHYNATLSAMGIHNLKSVVCQAATKKPSACIGVVTPPSEPLITAPTTA